MVETDDHRPPFAPQSSWNSEDATAQRRETQESTNEGFSSDNLCVQGPNNSRYNLRGRGIDEATHLRREEHMRKGHSRREEHKRKRLELKERKCLREQQKIKDQEDVERVLQTKAILDENSKAWKQEQRKQRLSKQGGDKGDQKKTYKWEVINKPQKNYREWLPYESDEEFGTQFELKHTSWEVEKLTLDLARCVVGLESFTGDKKERIFSCSGTIVEFVGDTGCVVTSASLVRCPEKDEIADKLKINVYLASGVILEGFVSNVDFYYNICVLKVPCTSHLPTKGFSPNTGFFSFYEYCSKDVVALGRSYEPWSLKIALGKLIPRSSRFDCEELCVSSCKISKRGVGGPQMDFDGNVIGMSFYDKKETPFLPSFIVLKCLQHFKNFENVIRPLYGLRVQTLYEAKLSVLEQKIQHGLPERCGVIVQKVEEPSVELSEIKVGDIITHVDGVPFSNAAELGGILPDMCEKLWQDKQKSNLSDNRNPTATVMSLEFRVRTYRGRNSEITTLTIDVNKFTPSRLNRWPLPRPFIVRQYEDGKLVDEQRYTTDVVDSFVGNTYLHRARPKVIEQKRVARIEPPHLRE